MPTLTTVVLVDDDPFTRDLWFRRLNQRAGFRCTGVFADAESALPWLLAHPPALLLADWKLPLMDGIVLIARVKATHPGVRAVLITNHDLEELPQAALRAGVNGCLLKPDSPAALPARLRAVMDGTCVFSARVMQRFSEQLHAGPPVPPDVRRLLALLTAREREVLRAFARGLPGKLVADLLQISETTVKTHKEHIVLKLGVQSFMEAVARFARHLSSPGASRPLPAILLSGDRRGRVPSATRVTVIPVPPPANLGRPGRAVIRPRPAAAGMGHRETCPRPAGRHLRPPANSPQHPLPPLMISQPPVLPSQWSLLRSKRPLLLRKHPLLPSKRSLLLSERLLMASKHPMMLSQGWLLVSKRSPLLPQLSFRDHHQPFRHQRPKFRAPQCPLPGRQHFFRDQQRSLPALSLPLFSPSCSFVSIRGSTPPRHV